MELPDSTYGGLLALSVCLFSVLTNMLVMTLIPVKEHASECRYLQWLHPVALQINLESPHTVLHKFV